MIGKYTVSDISSALAARSLPTITYWNRLEGRPRANNFDRALRAEVRDPLWMLTRQWQMGEFEGDDAGSPITAKVRVDQFPLQRYKAVNGAAEPFPTDLPMETKVEQMEIQWEWDDREVRLDLRLQLARQWRKMLQAATLSNYFNSYLAEYPVTMPPRTRDTAYLYAHSATMQQFAAAAGRSMDGGKFLKHLASGAAADNITLVNPGDDVLLNDLGTQFLDWYKAMYVQPEASDSDAWQAQKLEYQLQCSASENGREKVLSAEEYYHGHLDWYAFDHDRQAAGIGASPQNADTITKSFIPARIAFDGMPETRWWALEDRKTNFGAIDPAKTDLAQVMLMEFALVYANDWFVVPFAMPVGALAKVRGMTLTNVFGERFWIEAAGQGNDQDWHRWNMYSLNIKGDAAIPADTSLLMTPATAKMQEGEPEEEILFVRDEMANMAWAIETTIPHADGRPGEGKVAAEELRRYHEAWVLDGGTPPEPAEYQAPVYYRAMTSVPENWIPFIPVHLPGSNREIQLQRARMLRIIDGDPQDPPEKVDPRCSLVREGLDKSPKLAYYIHEEEIPRAGIKVTQSFQRTRWVNGQAPVWLGIRKQTGRGERSSGLSFDKLANSPASNE